MTLQICEMFKGVTPFSLRKENAEEVFLLMRKLKKFGKHHETKNAQHFTNSVTKKRVTPDTASWW